MTDRVESEEIIVVFTAGDSPALGNIWRLTAKNSDFYIDPLGEAGKALHLSAHGPNDRFPDRHRFHMRMDRKKAAQVGDQGHFLRHSIPRKGLPRDGEEVAAGAFRVARIRWSWVLQRSRFRSAAVSGPAPELSGHQSGRRMGKLLGPNDAADLDLFVSYDRPFWPDEQGSLRDNARLGPLRNAAGLWLTATC